METRKSLKGKIALITGVGRSAGIGAAICREIASNGGDIFFAYWRQYDQETHGSDQNDPANIAGQLKQLGVRAESMEIDLSEPCSAERLFKAVEDRLGTPAILVNNACHDFEVPFVEWKCLPHNSRPSLSKLASPYTLLTLDQQTQAGWQNN